MYYKKHVLQLPEFPQQTTKNMQDASCLHHKNSMLNLQRFPLPAAKAKSRPDLPQALEVLAYNHFNIRLLQFSKTSVPF